MASESALESAGVGDDGVPHIMIHCAQLHAAGPPGPGYLGPGSNTTLDDDDGAMSHANTLAIVALSTFVYFLML